MGRPKEFDSDDAIDRAMHALWKHGYESCSVKALSELLDITRSSFYNTFGTREALFRLALDRYAEISPNIALAQATENTPLKPLLTSVFREVCAIRTADPDGRGCLALNSMVELGNVHELLGDRIIHGVRDMGQRLEQLLRWAVDRGEISPTTDIPGTALALLNLLVGLNLMSKA
ncbi:MAG: TetR/AcrR family transcriptional regulator, partial [Pseudomonadota bacterium]